MLKKIFVSIFIAVSLVFSSKLWLDRFYEISFDIQTRKQIEVQVFYAKNFGDEFSKKNSVKAVISKDKIQNISLHLPIRKIRKIKIDMGSNPGKVEINKIYLKGTKSEELKLNNFIFDQIESYNFKNGKLLLTSAQDNSAIIYKDKLKIGPSFKIKYLMLFGIICASFIPLFILFKVFQKIPVSSSRLNVLFCSLFFICLFIPMLNISDAEKSLEENRMLAKKPSVSDFFDNDKNYGKQFESWFNDRFYKRKKILGFYNLISNIFSSYQNSKVIIGKDGWLFYKMENSINNYKNIDLYTDDELLKISQYLQDINDWCKKNGKEFIYLIAPDKNKIYGQYYPDTIIKIRPDDQSKTQQLITYLSNTDINVVYPIGAIKKCEDLTYYKNDTHWNEMGSYIAYNELVKVSNTLKKIEIAGFNFMKNEIGGLTKMWGSIKPDTLTQYKVPKYKNLAKCDHELSSIENTVCLNKAKTKEAFVLRDSFMTALSSYINQNFKKVSYRWRYDFTSEDLSYIKKNVDVVILENVERHMRFLIGFEFPERVE